MDLFYPHNDAARLEFVDSAIKCGFEKLAAELIANINLLSLNDKLTVLSMAWTKVEEYLSHHQYCPYLGNAVNWIGHYTLELWFGRDWIECEIENKTTLINLMMKVYPTAYAAMHPYAWPHMFSIYRDPWMVEYLNLNFVRMTAADTTQSLEPEDSEFIKQEGICLLLLRMTTMFDFNMVKLVQFLSLRLLLAWQDATSSTGQALRASFKAREYMFYARHVYLIAIFESSGAKDLYHILDRIGKNMYIEVCESGHLEKGAQVLALGLLESKKTLNEFINQFLFNSNNLYFNNTFGNSLKGYIIFLTKYMLKKLNSENTENSIASKDDADFEKLIQLFIIQRNSSEEYLTSTVEESESIFSEILSLSTLKFAYNHVKEQVQTQWHSTKIILLLGIISEELNVLQQLKYNEVQATDEIIEKHEELAIYYKDLAKLLINLPMLEQEAWLTAFSLHPCKEYMEAVIRCGQRNIRAIRKQAQKLGLVPTPEPRSAKKIANESKQTDQSNKTNEETKIDSIKEEKIEDTKIKVEIVLPCSSSTVAPCSIEKVPVAQSEGVKSTNKSDTKPKKQVKRIRKKKENPEKASKKKAQNTAGTTKIERRGRPLGSFKKPQKPIIPEKVPLPPKIEIKKEKVNEKEKDTIEELYAGGAGAGFTQMDQTKETIKYSPFALINSIINTEQLMLYTCYENEVQQYQELNLILSKIKLRKITFDDFLALLESPRYKLLTWTVNWKTLKKRCRILMTKKNRKRELVEQTMADANDRLAFLNVDYEKYKHLPQMDYGTVEPGYECFLKDSDDDSKEEQLILPMAKPKRKPPTKKRRKRKTNGKSLEDIETEDKVLSAEEIPQSLNLSKPIFLDKPVYIVRKLSTAQKRRSSSRSSKDEEPSTPSDIKDISWEVTTSKPYLNVDNDSKVVFSIGKTGTDDKNLENQTETKVLSDDNTSNVQPSTSGQQVDEKVNNETTKDETDSVESKFEKAVTEKSDKEEVEKEPDLKSTAEDFSNTKVLFSTSSTGTFEASSANTSISTQEEANIEKTTNSVKETLLTEKKSIEETENLTEVSLVSNDVECPENVKSSVETKDISKEIETVKSFDTRSLNDLTILKSLLTQKKQETAKISASITEKKFDASNQEPEKNVTTKEVVKDQVFLVPRTPPSCTKRKQILQNRRLACIDPPFFVKPTTFLPTLNDDLPSTSASASSSVLTSLLAPSSTSSPTSSSAALSPSSSIIATDILNDHLKVFNEKLLDPHLKTYKRTKANSIEERPTYPNLRCFAVKTEYKEFYYSFLKTVNLLKENSMEPEMIRVELINRLRYFIFNSIYKQQKQIYEECYQKNGDKDLDDAAVLTTGSVDFTMLLNPCDLLEFTDNIAFQLSDLEKYFIGPIFKIAADGEWIKHNLDSTQALDDFAEARRKAGSPTLYSPTISFKHFSNGTLKDSVPEDNTLLQQKKWVEFRNLIMNLKETDLQKRRKNLTTILTKIESEVMEKETDEKEKPETVNAIIDEGTVQTENESVKNLAPDEGENNSNIEPSSKEKEESLSVETGVTKNENVVELFVESREHELEAIQRTVEDTTPSSTEIKSDIIDNKSLDQELLSDLEKQITEEQEKKCIEEKEGDCSNKETLTVLPEEKNDLETQQPSDVSDDSNRRTSIRFEEHPSKSNDAQKRSIKVFFKESSHQKEASKQRRFTIATNTDVYGTHKVKKQKRRHSMQCSDMLKDYSEINVSEDENDKKKIKKSSSTPLSLSGNYNLSELEKINIRRSLRSKIPSKYLSDFHLGINLEANALCKVETQNDESEKKMSETLIAEETSCSTSVKVPRKLGRPRKRCSTICLTDKELCKHPKTSESNEFNAPLIKSRRHSLRSKVPSKCFGIPVESSVSSNIRRSSRYRPPAKYLFDFDSDITQYSKKEIKRMKATEVQTPEASNQLSDDERDKNQRCTRSQTPCLNWKTQRFSRSQTPSLNWNLPKAPLKLKFSEQALPVRCSTRERAPSKCFQDLIEFPCTKKRSFGISKPDDDPLKDLNRQDSSLDEAPLIHLKQSQLARVKSKTSSKNIKMKRITKKARFTRIKKRRLRILAPDDDPLNILDSTQDDVPLIKQVQLIKGKASMSSKINKMRRLKKKTKFTRIKNRRIKVTTPDDDPLKDSNIDSTQDETQSVQIKRPHSIRIKSPSSSKRTKAHTRRIKKQIKSKSKPKRFKKFKSPYKYVDKSDTSEATIPKTHQRRFTISTTDDVQHQQSLPVENKCYVIEQPIKKKRGRPRKVLPPQMPSLTRQDISDYDSIEDKVYECSISTTNDSDADDDADYVPRRRRKLVKPVRLRCISRRSFVIDSSNDSSACASPANVPRFRKFKQADLPYRQYIKSKSIQESEIMKSEDTIKCLSASEEAAILKYNCIDFDIRLTKLTVKEASLCRKPVIKLNRDDVQNYFASKPI